MACYNFFFGALLQLLLQLLRRPQPPWPQDLDWCPREGEETKTDAQDPQEPWRISGAKRPRNVRPSAIAAEHFWLGAFES